MILNLELNDDIYKTLETAAVERGLTVKELIRWVIGDYVRYSQPPTMRAGPSIIPFLPSRPMESETTKLLKLSGLFMKDMINHGGLKCSNCTLPLTMEDIEQGKCSKCDAEI